MNYHTLGIIVGILGALASTFILFPAPPPSKRSWWYVLLEIVVGLAIGAAAIIPALTKDPIAWFITVPVCVVTTGIAVLRDKPWKL